MIVQGIPTKAWYDEQQEIRARIPGWPLGNIPVEEYIQRAVNNLLGHLYRPDAEHPWGWVADTLNLGQMANDPINWGDLRCVEVEQAGASRYRVCIEEASPDAVHLQEYVAEWLQDWGWDVEVMTEW